MTKKMIESRIIRASNNRLLCLKYYLTEKHVSLLDSFDRKSIYGVIIEKYNIEEEVEIYICSKEANGISDKFDVVCNIVKTLADGTVTPTTLLEILDEMIS